jgi:hypothetical protein
MPPKQLDIRPIPDRSFACKTARRRFKKQNIRNLAQLLLAPSDLCASAIAELAAQARQQVVASRTGQPDRASAPACADPAGAREPDSSPVCTQPAVASAGDASFPAPSSLRAHLDLAREALQESRELSAAVHRVLSRIPERVPRRLSPPPVPVPAPVAGPPAAPSLRSEDQPALEYAKIRRPAAEFEAAHLDQVPRPRAPAPPGGVAVPAPQDIAELLLPDGTSVGRALAARDASIAHLRFQLSEREKRHRIDSIGRATAFVRDSSNQFAVPPARPPLPQPGRAPAPPCGAPPPALTRPRPPLQLPKVPRRVRGPRSSGPPANSEQPACAGPPDAVLAAPPRPPA